MYDRSRTPKLDAILGGIIGISTAGLVLFAIGFALVGLVVSLLGA